MAVRTLVADVETLRRTVISARAEDDVRGGYAYAADKLVSSWSLDRAEQVALAFTCYFHLRQPGGRAVSRSDAPRGGLRCDRDAEG